MTGKPEHLDPAFAERFKYRSMAEAYKYRAPYPAATFELILGLLPEGERTILDAGCGPGTLALHLVEHVNRVDAVDPSLEMIRIGRNAPNGQHPRLRWIAGRIEDVTLAPPYSLIVCGTSLHWMDFDLVFPLFKSCLRPDGYLVIVRVFRDLPWRNAERRVLYEYSTIRSFEPYNLIDEIIASGLFEKVGEEETGPVSVEQSIEDYSMSYHSKERFCTDAMGNTGAIEFQKQMRAALLPYSKENKVTFSTKGIVTWGRPR
ncbi:MAG: hypothetical protein QOH49_3922 [Acidobacteriota bacterium]|jgi:SAM-dependent methyltransferase|nr:hypothetical protein [Acidobacteriota bacterium]